MEKYNKKIWMWKLSLLEEYMEKADTYFPLQFLLWISHIQENFLKKDIEYHPYTYFCLDWNITNILSYIYIYILKFVFGQALWK